MTKQPETTSELVLDPIFRQKVEEGISKIRKHRLNRSDPKPGFRYKRNWYDRMDENRQLRLTFFLDNIIEIWEKRSKLPSESRTVILSVCDLAAVSTLRFYAERKIEPEGIPVTEVRP